MKRKIIFEEILGSKESEFWNPVAVKKLIMYTFEGEEDFVVVFEGDSGGITTTSFEKALEYYNKVKKEFSGIEPVTSFKVIATGPRDGRTFEIIGTPRGYTGDRELTFSFDTFKTSPDLMRVEVVDSVTDTIEEFTVTDTIFKDGKLIIKFIRVVGGIVLRGEKIFHDYMLRNGQWIVNVIFND